MSSCFPSSDTVQSAVNLDYFLFAPRCCFLKGWWCVTVLPVCRPQVCDAVQVRPGLPEQLLQVLEEFSAAGGAEVLYDRLSCLLQPWPLLLRDFAAFLTPGQASRCGLVGDVITTSHV